jgi:hypothetical protein
MITDEYLFVAVVAASIVLVSACMHYEDPAAAGYQQSAPHTPVRL